MTLCGSLRSRDWACVGKMVSEKESQRDLRFGDLFGDLGLWRFVDRVGAMCVKIVIELQINL